jgi:hypothetical protein
MVNIVLTSEGGKEFAVIPYAQIEYISGSANWLTIRTNTHEYRVDAIGDFSSDGNFTKLLRGDDDVKCVVLGYKSIDVKRLEKSK